jgi:outer membrane lipase/esterase
MQSIPKLLGSAILSLAALGGNASATLAPPWSSLVVFGDSLSDGGNNSLLPFVGVDATQVILGNTYIPSLTYAPAPGAFSTYSNGPVWATQFAVAMGLNPLPSLAGGTNYAFGGATTSGGLIPSLLAQVAAPVSSGLPGYLTKQTNGKADPDALYVIAGGGNNARDTFAALATNSNFGSIGSIAGAAASQYANDIGNIVDMLQDAGAKNIIVWNTPNIGTAPAITSGVPFTLSGLTGAQLGSLVSGTMNGALQTRLAGETGVKTFDLYGLAAKATQNGFTNTTDACGAPSNASKCLDIDKALFWDGIHPTTAGHTFIASQMAVLAAVPEPSEIAMMVVGLFVVAGIARRRKLAQR